MKKFLAYLARYGTPVCLTISGILSILVIIPFGFGLPSHTFDEKTNTNLAGKNTGKLSCSDYFIDNTHAIYYTLPNIDYHFQCGYSVFNIILTFLFEIISVVEIVLFWVFVLVWRKKKLITFIVYCCLLVPIIMQCYLLVHHCSEIHEGRKSCRKAKVDAQAECSILPFVFTPVVDSFNVVFLFIGTGLGTVLYFCRPRVNKALDVGNTDGEYKKGLVEGKKGKSKKVEEEEEDPIKDIKNAATGIAVSGMIDFTKFASK
ncbi:hypothetical protein ENUP19_0203G0004 [Entamoeba nuttalli]|uniref:Uncharacterized protein n=2 Tax=Entamoeba nuttalli TaxID=412467 RepID=K2H281_ENTNP|nr:hypothetical protein ENU1_091350 [Entamoeba nuttalli P19]EKE40412.1 hypothetical protein ENU1_091350 [Entamoeba nuttalli P19]|eukprot:XP_008857254.1 hypothetical protein ENU1_091350 [Entamoeba nuttalli P19]